MNKHTIVTIPGDGIGREVLPAAIKVLDKAGFNAEYIHADMGWELWCKKGNPFPQRTIDLLSKHKIGLFGAITSKPKSDAARELSPELQNKGYTYFSPIVGMRQKFQLDICIRPCKSFPGNPLNFIQKSTNGSIVEPKIDTVIFRQNTEGLYAGVEWTNPPDRVRNAFESHSKFKPYLNTPGEELAISTRIFTQKACNRIVEEAFKYASEFGYKSVTVCEKPNVIRETSGMMLQTAQRIQNNFPEIKLQKINIDAMMMFLTKNPEKYGVIVAGNLFGDIVSDGFAGLVGGLGFACSANIGKDVAVFEPTHGSAPDLPPMMANPIAMIMSTCMMLDYLDEKTISKNILNAVSSVIMEGNIQSYDMLNLDVKSYMNNKNVATTNQIVSAIIEKL